MVSLMVTLPTSMTNHPTPPHTHTDHVTTIYRARSKNDLTIPDPNRKSTKGTPRAPAVGKPFTSTLITLYTTAPPINQLVQSIILPTSKSISTPKPPTLELRSDSHEERYTKSPNYLKLPLPIRHYTGPTPVSTQETTTPVDLNRLLVIYL